MSPSIECIDVSVRFGDVVALDRVTTSIHAGAITGLLGRNGAGKSTMLSLIASYRRPSSGIVRVDGVDPFEHEASMRNVVLASTDRLSCDAIVDVLGVAAAFRPYWDADYADHLLDLFGLPRKGSVSSLSTGQRSALSNVVGLATRAPLTMFDEPHLGLDAPSRSAFYDELLADYLRYPRTIIVSTHLIDEIAPMLEHVLMIDRGRVVCHEPSEQLGQAGVQLTGPTDAVDALASASRVISERDLGRTRSVVVLGAFDDERRDAATRTGVDVAAVPLQELFIHLTSEEARQ